MRILLALVALLVLTTSCATVQEQLAEVSFDVDLDALLDEVRDCDRLSEQLVGLVRTAADAADTLAANRNGRLPETTIRETVDKIAVSRFFGIAERIGCTQLEFRLRVIDDLRGIPTETPAGEDVIEEILRQLEAQG
jgi:hypothetical protein